MGGLDDFGCQVFHFLLAGYVTSEHFPSPQLFSQMAERSFVPGHQQWKIPFATSSRAISCARMPLEAPVIKTFRVIWFPRSCHRDLGEDAAVNPFKNIIQIRPVMVNPWFFNPTTAREGLPLSGSDLPPLPPVALCRKES